MASEVFVEKHLNMKKIIVCGFTDPERRKKLKFADVLKAKTIWRNVFPKQILSEVTYMEKMICLVKNKDISEDLEELAEIQSKVKTVRSEKN